MKNQTLIFFPAPLIGQISNTRLLSYTWQRAHYIYFTDIFWRWVYDIPNSKLHVEQLPKVPLIGWDIL